MEEKQPKNHLGGASGDHQWDSINLSLLFKIYNVSGHQYIHLRSFCLDAWIGQCNV